MDHTKKFVLVDPRFARPSMREKVLSELDTQISNILNSDAPDDIKAMSYVSTLTRFKHYSAPPKPEEPKTAPTPAPPTPPIPAPAAPAPTTVSTVSFPIKARSSLKRSRKRVKVEPLDPDPSLELPLWRRTLRSTTKKKFGPQWIEYNENSKKKKSYGDWIEL
jgi:hypothetical protein